MFVAVIFARQWPFRFVGWRRGFDSVSCLILGLSFGKTDTHKVASVALGLGASIKHLKAKTLRWRESAIILGAGLPGVVLGSVFVFQIPDQWAQLALGCLTCSLGCIPFLSHSWACNTSHGIDEGVELYGYGRFVLWVC